MRYQLQCDGKNTSALYHRRIIARRLDNQMKSNQNPLTTCTSINIHIAHWWKSIFIQIILMFSTLLSVWLEWFLIWETSISINKYEGCPVEFLCTQSDRTDISKSENPDKDDKQTGLHISRLKRKKKWISSSIYLQHEEHVTPKSCCELNEITIMSTGRQLQI